MLTSTTSKLSYYFYIVKIYVRYNNHDFLLYVYNVEGTIGCRPVYLYVINALYCIKKDK